MKRIMSLLILAFMVGSVFVPFLPSHAVTTMVFEPILLSSTPNPRLVREVLVESDPIELAISEMSSKMDVLDFIDDNMEWYISYKSIIEEYSDILDAPETIYDYFTDDEIYLMQRVVETECYQCNFDSKVNVASVVLNRVENGELFGESVEKVVTSPNQFAYGRKIITESTILALEYAFQIEDSTGGCIGFHSNSKKERFNGWTYSFTDEAGHHFYK